MIAKAIPMKTAEKSHFAKLVGYITDDQDTPFRLGPINLTNCYSYDYEDAVYEVLNTQRQNQRAVSDKTYHLIVSFRPGEEPSPETLQAIEVELCAGLGFSGHQRISAVHCDTENLHIHVAINKVHPVKHTIHNPYQDYKTLAKLCAKLEKQYGLEIDNHQTQRNYTAARAVDMERHSGIESLITWVQQNALDNIKQSNTWQELHARLYEHGLSIKPRGNGLAISTLDEELGVKASSVARELSKIQLEQRLSSYQPAHEQSLAGLTVKQHYERKPVIAQQLTKSLNQQNQGHQMEPANRRNQSTHSINNTRPDLYRGYQIQMAEQTVIRNDALHQAKAQHQAQIQQAKTKATHKRRLIKTLIQSGLSKKLLLGLICKSLHADINSINTEYRHIRQRLYKQHRRLSWLDWLQLNAKRGNQEALQLLRQRHIDADTRGNYLIGKHSQTQDYDPPLAKAKVTKKGTVFYLHNKAVIKDDGNRFHVATETNPELITTALTYAKQRHGYRLSILGSELFQENVVRASVKGGLNISFDQDHLERRRVQLSAELQLFGEGAVRSLSQQLSRGMRR